MDVSKFGKGVDLKQLKKWIEKHAGKRCKTYCFGCLTCQAWRIYDDLVKLLNF